METEQLGTVEDVFDRLMTFKNWEKKDLAEALGLDPSTLSQKLGAHWNKHFQVFLKMLPLMVEAGMIDRKQLCGASDKNGGPQGGGGGAKLPKVRKVFAKVPLLLGYIMSTFRDTFEQFQRLTASATNVVMLPLPIAGFASCN